MAIKVLTALDLAKTQFYHFKAIMIAGMGLFTDAYDLFCITPVMKLIGRIYYEPKGGNPGTAPPGMLSAVVGVALAGTVIGNLLFGTLGDRVGRRRVYGFTLVLMVAATFACGFSICRTRACVLTSLCFFRFLLGVAIGGDYPLSATIMSEFANKKTRGSFIAAVFSMQGFGILASSAVTMAVTAAFNRATSPDDISPVHTPEAADIAWRLIVMIGGIPAAFTFYWRMSMPETARYTALVEQDVVKATNDMSRLLGDLNLSLLPLVEGLPPPPPPPPPPSTPTPTYGFLSMEFLRGHGRDLFACAAAWFLIDIPYYGSTLFQSQIYQPWFPPAQRVNAYQEAFNVAKFQAVIAVASTIPGYFATVYFIERVGRRKIQMLGFLMMAVFLFVLAGPYNSYWQHNINAGFIVLYALTFFFSNFGPNTTTFIVPAELFPARFRTTCHGISGAAGKAGAVIGSIGFLWASQSRKSDSNPGIGMTNALIILGAVCVAGVLLTWLFTPETKMRSLEENEGGRGAHHGSASSNGREATTGANGRELRRSTSDATSPTASAASPYSDLPLTGPSPMLSPPPGEETRPVQGHLRFTR